MAWPTYWKTRLPRYAVPPPDLPLPTFLCSPWWAPLHRLLCRVHVRCNGCWEWTGSRLPKGYGTWSAHGETMRAHRLFYQLFYGPLPGAPLEADHLCRFSSCVNPRHIEFVTHTENVRRARQGVSWNGTKTHCPQGHEYTPENTYINGGRRYCRTCQAAAQRKWAEKKKISRVY